MSLLKELFHMSTLTEEIDKLIEVFNDVCLNEDDSDKFLDKRARKIAQQGFNKLRVHSKTHAAHSVRVGKLAKDFAKYLGLDHQLIGYNAITHDLGKILVPRKLLHKPGVLDPDTERPIVNKHAGDAEKYLADSPGRMGSMARALAAYHHTPAKEVDEYVRDEEMTPQEGEAVKVMTISDIFDSLTCEDRTYKYPHSKFRALEEMKKIPILDPVLKAKFLKWQLENFTNEYRPEYVYREEARLFALYKDRLEEGGELWELLRKQREQFELSRK